MIKRRTWWIVLSASVLVVALAAILTWLAFRPSAAHYVTAPVTRGDVATTITASGTVNPVVTVEVGTYVSGPIISLACDYNTKVRKGQLCAKIDPQPYAVVVEEDRAALANAQAQLVKDQANVAYAKLALQRQTLLLSENSTSQDAVDQARNASDQAAAQVGVDVAAIAEKKASLDAAQINLNYTNIVSPVDGTVVSRNVTAGQTVAASFTTPTLFLVATDLTKMEVDANVSESDIAGAAVGAGAAFTVDAFPNRSFQGRVVQVRQSPISVQNVITYDVVLAVDNPQLLLKPGMTATAKITKAQASGVLRIPSQALRFTPAGSDKLAAKRGGQRVVWVQQNDKLAAVPVTVGLDDETYAEITAGDLRVGDQVIVSAAPGKAGKASAGAGPTLRL